MEYQHGYRRIISTLMSYNMVVKDLRVLKRLLSSTCNALYYCSDIQFSACVCEASGMYILDTSYLWRSGIYHKASFSYQSGR